MNSQLSFTRRLALSAVGAAALALAVAFTVADWSADTLCTCSSEPSAAASTPSLALRRSPCLGSVAKVASLLNSTVPLAFVASEKAMVPLTDVVWSTPALKPGLNLPSLSWTPPPRKAFASEPQVADLVPSADLAMGRSPVS